MDVYLRPAVKVDVIEQPSSTEHDLQIALDNGV
jgi:hypothetical protein